MFQHPDLKVLVKKIQKISRLGSTLSLLGWDQETLMPESGAMSRAAVIGDLTEVVHRMITDDALGESLSAAEAALDAEGDSRAEALVREVRRTYERKRRIPAELAEEIARTASQSIHAWKQARKQSDFPTFQPWLEKLVQLKRREAEAVGGGKGLYNALLDEYEPGCTAEHVQKLVDHVKPVLRELVAELAPVSARSSSDCLNAHYDIQAQAQFARQVITDLGFDFKRGRVDISTHPFCSGISSPDDVRLTTRYDSNDFATALFGIIHEAGHGLYEQGLSREWQNTPLAEAISMGIHESQSRLWENMVARSHAFWSHYLPGLKKRFPASLAEIDLDTFLKAVNRVRPSLIRVEADEATYNQHIMLRFEIEQQLVEGTVEVGDLPALWNEGMQSFLGITPPNDAVGVLQDIHWSFGAFGYFPTYFLGNLYAAQFYQTARETIDDFDGHIAAGDFQPLREWLREEIHRHGRLYRAGELCERVTQKALQPQALLNYLSDKLHSIFANGSSSV
ncbi:MAG: carboxypeptidase M32 [Planctomycetota bacterium]